MNTNARFFSKTSLNEMGCLIWTGVKNGKKNYGQFWLDGKMCYAHRTAYELKYGKIPSDLLVLHRCNNTECVNVEHLYIGTQSDNMAQCHIEGRNPQLQPKIGEANGQAKLTEDQVRLIRQSPNSHRKLAKEFGVSKSVIGAIKRRERWTHVS